MSYVHTKLGLIPRKDLKLKFEFDETDNALCVATEWYYNGELVRRDAWANVLRAETLAGAQPQLG